jgi:folylpolyglutamate synthase/dihydropteroate synthase
MVEDVGVLHEQLRMIQQDAIVQSPTQIIELAQKNPEELFVVFGSLYMIGEFLNIDIH